MIIKGNGFQRNSLIYMVVGLDEVVMLIHSKELSQEKHLDLSGIVFL